MMLRASTRHARSVRSFHSTPIRNGALPGGLDEFGAYCFNRTAMREYLANPDEIFDILDNRKPWDKRAIEKFTEGAHQWAVDKGCTHVTHVFQPLSGALGEKHDIMFGIDSEGTVETKLKPENILSSEPDASSFPHGKTRTTHQARGNCIWDPQSFLTIGKLGESSTLRVPAIFVGWNGLALDLKTPLLRSEQTVHKELLNLLRVVGDQGNTTAHTFSGLEQEFFMVEEQFYNSRPDLSLTGRTLIGRDASRGQDHGDRYFGWQSTKMQDALFEMEQEFWRLAIPNSTRHREAAPAQYEMAPSFGTANQSNDNNLMMMQVMREVAKRHGLACLLHEKPFANINGSGKHNNWSLGTNKHRMLFTPSNPHFMLMLSAFIRAVHLHGDVLRATVATAGNDLRLGGHEAPPGIMSIYLGEEVNELVLKAIKGEKCTPKDPELQDFGVDYLPKFFRQSTDRNRTSPIAFCGNRFEFRAVGSSANTAWSTTALNTIVADSLKYLAEEISERKSRGEVDPVSKVVGETLAKHQCAVFNGNGYSEEWVQEAARRGLPNSRDTPASLEKLYTKKNIELFRSMKVLNEEELKMRSTVAYENYFLDALVEARTLRDMINQHVLPSACAQFNLTRDIQGAENRTAVVSEHINILTQLIQKMTGLEGSLLSLPDEITKAELVAKEVRPLVQQIRKSADFLEGVVAANLWTLPTYHQMLHVGH